jgi:uncharacterized alpha-E superfamily protein
MLSRIADSLFWTARYMDRAENTARLLDVTYHTLLEEARQAYHLRWDAVIRITGDQFFFRTMYDDANPRNVIEFYLFREDNPNSIASCVARVRENARTIRDRLSRELWENINGTYHRVREMQQSAEVRERLHLYCAEMIAASHAFNGIVDSTLAHDDGWHFLQMGRSLERAQHTARVVDVEYHRLLEGATDPGSTDPLVWRAVLMSVAAFEMYRRAYPSGIDAERVAELLILNRLLPRSIRFNFAWLQLSLRAISGTGPQSYANEAERLTGKVLDALVYDRIEDIFARGLHNFLSDVERNSRQINDGIARSYFHYAAGAA